MITKYGPGRSLQGLSGVGIACVGRNIPELHAPFLVAPLGGSKTVMESSAANNTPSQTNGALCVPCYLPEDLLS